MLFTIFYIIVMSVNRFDTKLWLLLHSLLDCFVRLKEKKMCKYLNLFKVFRLICIWKTVKTNIQSWYIFRLFIVIYVTLANLTEHA